MAWFFITLLTLTSAQPAATDVFQLQPAIPEQTELVPLQQAYQHSPSFENKLNLVNAYLQVARRPGRSDYFHQAEALLAEHDLQTQQTPALLLSQADILQQQHHFSAALKRLDQLLQTAPQHLQANLMAARIQLAMGETEAAQRACNRLLREALFFFATCSYEVTGRKGQWQQAYQGLTALFKQNANLSPELDIWVRGILAEQAEQLQDLHGAIAWLEPILTQAPTSIWLKWADLQLAVAQPQAVYQRLAELAEQLPLEDSLLLRLAIAERELGLAAHYVTQIDEQMQVRILRQDQDHAADLAHYFLRFTANAEAALHWAELNYQSAREPDDLALLLQSRVAVKQAQQAVQPKQTGVSK